MPLKNPTLQIFIIVVKAAMMMSNASAVMVDSDAGSLGMIRGWNMLSGFQGTFKNSHLKLTDGSGMV